MKVLIISPEYLPVPNIKGGAVETLLNQYLDYNEINQINDVTVYSIFDKNINNNELVKYKQTKFRYINYKKKKYLIRKFIFAFLRRIFKSKVFPTIYYSLIVKDIKLRKEVSYYDLIILENGMKGSKIFHNNLKSKIILHLHNDKINKNISESKDILSNVDELWVVSKYLKERVLEVDAKATVKILPNGVDFKIFLKSMNKEAIRQFLYKYKINSKFVILYSGRLMREKGVLEMIKAYNNINLPKANLLIAGDFDGKDLEKFKSEFLNECNKNKSIILLGKVKYEDMPILYKIADLQIVPSIVNEAFGMILVEGMINKVPIIASNSGAIPEIIKDNLNGLIVDKTALVKNLEEKMLYLYSNKKIRKKIGENAYKTAINYSNEKYCELFNYYIMSK
ncbi:MAG: glycosyltransferase family 4 protein [Bacilli bacterium]|nr:glycosyltransferase family 4 protein [Bacilli bacterium]